MEALSNAFESARRSTSVALGLEEERPKTTWEKVQEVLNLSWKQRFIGWLIGTGLGIFFFVIAFLLFEVTLVPEFAVAYTIGNLLLVAGLLVLAGPVSQAKNLTQPSRLISVCVFVLSMIVTLFVAFTSNGGAWVIVILIAVLLQLAAFAWYALSYIPFGQSLVTSSVSGIVASV
jgi:uncharacterized membrane protein HdeD (DUF308 family)